MTRRSRELRVLAGEERPRTRDACPPERPCGFVGCPAHLALHVSPAGTLHAVVHGHAPGLKPSADELAFETFADDVVEGLFRMRETCVLDIVERGEKPGARRQAELLNETNQAVSATQRNALDKLEANPDARALWEALRG